MANRLAGVRGLGELNSAERLQGGNVYWYLAPHPNMSPPSMSEQPSTVLIDTATIAERVRRLGAEITRRFADHVSAESPLVVVAVLKGSFVFAADLVRAMDLPIRVEFLGVRSYGDATSSSGVVQITQDLTNSVEGQNVLIVEDIVDSGLTCAFLIEQMKTRKPHSVALCSLLHKPARSVVPVEIDFLGFTIEDVFVVGYGLDVAQRFRNLPELRVFRD